VTWGERTVPVVSFEGAFGQALAERVEPDAIRDLSRLRRPLAGRLLGMLTQGFPQLVRVNAT